MATKRELTFLFTDIEGSTRLWEAHPTEMGTALARHDALLHQAVETAGGHVFKTVGDAFCAVFSRPEEAIEAAIASQRAIGEEPWPEPTPIRVRMAIHSGEVEERSNDYFGPPLNRVARILSAAHGGQILISSAAKSGSEAKKFHFRDLGSHRLKDLDRPESLSQLLAPGLTDEFPDLRTLEGYANNLPVQLSSFVGRETELAAIGRLLGETRMLTLSGSGGCGKTRLALQAAADSLERWPDGIWLVDLAPLTEASTVAHAAASALRIREEPSRPIGATLADALRGKQCLIVLDNCEHLLEASARLAEDLLRECPKLSILATSREALGIPGETAYRVPSLSLPDPDRTPSVEEAESFEAIRLFVERARAGQPSFGITEANLKPILLICRRLDGIPLAIELAAARVRVMTPDQVASRLDDAFRLLTGGSRTAMPRQQTLRAAIEWSYRMLTPHEALLLQRLSVFSGGWTLDAAEKVCSDDAELKAEVAL